MINAKNDIKAKNASEKVRKNGKKTVKIKELTLSAAPLVGPVCQN